MSDSVRKWLQQLGLEDFESLFAEHDIDAEVLPELTDADLKELGLTLGQRKKLLKTIAALQSSETESTTSGISPDDEATAAPVESSHAERRHLTVMFCDLVGSTALSERLDPEELREIIGDFHEMCAAAIRTFDGYIARYMGDGLLVYFGYPQAHEDDAERAVRTGLAIIDAVGGLATPDGAGLQVRVGIATGLVVAGDIVGEGASEERVVLGDTPNLAARLQSVAAPNAVMIADDTQQLVEGLFVVDNLGALSLKGISEPVSAYRVHRQSEAPSRFEAVAERGLIRLLGRESEIGLLLDRWTHAKEGEAQTVLLSGEAGVGKSRIVRAFRERIGEEPHKRVLFYCSPYHQNSALYPAIQQFERALRFAREDGSAQKFTKLEAVMNSLQLPVAETVPALASLLSVPAEGRYAVLELTPEQLKAKTLDALVAVIATMAAQQPVLMVVEDAHWIDPSTVELVSLVIDRLRGARVFLVITFRPEFELPWSGHAQVTALALNRLGRKDCTAMVGEVCAGRQLPDEVLDQIVARTDGVPLYVEELTKTILESGLLREVDGTYVVSGPLPSFAIPASLQDSLMARLDRLAPVKEVAQLAAAIGRTFSHELMAAVSLGSEGELEDALVQLARAELIFRRGAPPDVVYEFKHALVQDAAYQSLLKSTRRQYHQRIARVLKEQFPETANTQPELLAHHYTEAHIFDEAIDYWQRAGRRASERSANVEAISHLTKGLELLANLPENGERNELELRLHIALGALLMTTKGYAAPEVGHAFNRARELCQNMADTPELFPVVRGMWRYYQTGGDLQAARGLAEQCFRLAQSTKDPSVLLAAHVVMGITFYHVGEVTRAHKHFEQGIAIYQPAQHRSLAFLYGEDQGVVCLARSAHILWMLGYPEQALQTGRKALVLARELSHPYSLVYALVFACRLQELRRNWPTVQEQAEDALRRATEHGFAMWVAAATIAKGLALAMQGREEEGLAQLQQGLAAMRATGAEVALPWFLALLAKVHASRGQTAEGLAALAEALELAKKYGIGWYLPEIHRLKGELLLEHAHSDANMAETCFREALEVARRQQAKMLELRAATSLARLWHHRGKPREAHDLLASVYDWFTEGFDTSDLKEAKGLLQELRV